jgi:hypothetical protein
MTTTDGDDQAAVYAIHIAGPVGPILVSALLDAGAASAVPWDVRLEENSVLLVSVTEKDLVDVVDRLAEGGVEIDSVRELDADGAERSAPDD